MNKCISFKEFSADGSKKWDKSGRKFRKLWHIIFLYNIRELTIYFHFERNNKEGKLTKQEREKNPWNHLLKQLRGDGIYTQVEILATYRAQMVHYSNRWEGRYYGCRW